MNKKYIVSLSEQERQVSQEVIKKLKGTSQKVRRAHILLKADAAGPAWSDMRIAESFDCRRQTVEQLRQRVVMDGFDAALNGKQRQRRELSGRPFFTLRSSTPILAPYSATRPPSSRGFWPKYANLVGSKKGALGVGTHFVCQKKTGKQGQGRAVPS